MLLIPSIRRVIGGLAAVCLLSSVASAEPLVSKTYGYFSIGGRTAEALDRELERRGPMTSASGHRHPGATEIKFGGEVTYVERGKECSVGDVKVTLKTNLILPRWKNRRAADKNLRFIWDTLSADIKRHEERHAEIARSYARTLERDLRALRSARTCQELEKKVGAVTKRVLETHDRDQMRFDVVESKNFDNRMMRLLKYRLGENGG